MYNYFQDSIYDVLNRNVLSQTFINQIRHKYFNSDKEIDEIYEKLTNFKL